MNRKGFTLIELIVSIVLVSVVMVSMLMALVKLRENYSTVNENANALVYSNAASRIINNDILQNDGIKNVSCSANHLNCDMMLGNGNKRQLQIIEIAEDFSSQTDEGKIKTCQNYCKNNSDKSNENCNCNGKKAIGIIETKKTSLVYYDTTKEKKLKYIKTFELETKTQIDSGSLGFSTISGYSFLSLDTKYNTYKSNKDGYENKLATVIVRTYNGYDAEDRTYDIKMYSTSTYSEDSQLAGTVFKLKIIDDGDITKASPSTFYLKYDVGYYKDLDGEEIDSLDNVSSKTGYTLIGYNDSNGKEVIDKNGNFLSKIAFDNTNTSKKEGEVRPVWSANTYVVSFNASGGTLKGNASKEVTYDSTYGELPTVSREGYTFLGWYTATTGGTKVTSTTKVTRTENHTLYAQWRIDKIACSDLTYKCSNTSKGSNYNLTYSGNCEVLCEDENWKVRFLTSGNLTTTISLNVDVFLVGGGGGGNTTYEDEKGVAGGGGGGYTKTVKSITLQPNTYKIEIGAGGSGGNNGKSSSVKLNNSIINGLTAEGGKTGTISPGCCGYCSYGGEGGNTGGGWSDCNEGTPTYPTTFGKGQGSTTCEFGEGTTTGCNDGVKNYAEGGCCGLKIGGVLCSGTSGEANTGNGGEAFYLKAGSGGSGVVIMRNKR